MRYQVEYLKNNETLYEEIDECKDAGMAFARCQKKHPGATMVHLIAYSGQDGFEACTHYDPVPVQRDPSKRIYPARPMRPNETDGALPFYDEVVTHRAWDAGKILAVRSVRARTPNN